MALYNPGSTPAVVGEHITFNATPNLTLPSWPSAFYLTNSLLVGITNYGTNTVGSYNGTNSSSSAVFQTVGAGSHYLQTTSPYHNAGTPNITAQLLSDLKKKTTYPPLLLTNTIGVDTTLSPQAQRDTDAPDLGFHYSPMDYAAGSVIVTNATLTLTNGVALGTYTDVGLALYAGGHLTSQGSALNPNVIVRYNGVQEQSVTNWSSTNAFYNLVVYHHIPVSQVRSKQLGV